jgi:hypothetical protein
VEAGTDLTEIKERAMATIRLHQTTTVTPEQFLAGLTDFGPNGTVKAIEARKYQTTAENS